MFCCMVVGCTSNSVINKNIGWYKLPEEDELKKAWLKKCSTSSDNHENLLICSKHFDKTCFEDIENDGEKSFMQRKILKKNAVPTIFIQSPSMDFQSPLVFDDLNLKIKLKALNPHIVCMLCAGYLVNATTIVECLHTFCKSCIVRYIQINKKCPTCAKLVPETEPLAGLMLDRTMQDIVKKIHPRMEKDEERREKEFMASVNSQKSKVTEKRKIEDREKALPHFEYFPVNYRTDEQINICLQLDDIGGVAEMNGLKVVQLTNQFVRCSARIQITHVKKMIKKLHEPHACNYTVDISCNEHSMDDRENLRMAYALYWHRKQQPMVLKYRFESIT